VKQFWIFDFGFSIARIESKNFFVLALCALLLALSFSAEAQQAKKVPRIGYLAVNSPSLDRQLIGAFQQGLRGLGWIDGESITIEYRFAEGNLDQLHALVAELVALKVDVIVSAGGTPPALAAKNATTTIPIVFISTSDPVASGLVASLARPGGNVTGFSNIYSELSGKGLELVKELLPKISRAASLWNPANPATLLSLKETERAAGALRIQLQSLKVRGPQDFETAFSQMTGARAEALLIQADPIFRGERARLAELAVKNRLPTVLPQSTFVEAGGLMSYGTNGPDLYRRAATYVDKILRGAKPADLPVQQPTKFELVINLKTAKQIGLTIPQSVLYRADKVIK
jgi:putative tryptophan/tyrosine transport system substrate-binding protein